MIALIAALALAATPTLRNAYGLDHVYVYGPTGNTNYQCDVFLAYFNTEDESVFYADNCYQTSVDSTNWPHFAPQNIRVSLDFFSRKMSRISDECLFVAHAQNADRTTSTVIDCR